MSIKGAYFTLCKGRRSIIRSTGWMSSANSLFLAASAIYWMLGHDSIAAVSQQVWRKSLEKVMAGFARRFPAFVRFTGFPADWQTLALWK